MIKPALFLLPALALATPVPPFSQTFARVTGLRPGLEYRRRFGVNEGCGEGELKFVDRPDGRIDVTIGGEPLVTRVGEPDRWSDDAGCAWESRSEYGLNQVDVRQVGDCAGRPRHREVLILATAGGFQYRVLADGTGAISCALIRR